MPYKKFPRMSRTDLQRQSIDNRRSLINSEDFMEPGTILSAGRPLSQIFPDFLAARDIKSFCQAMAEARRLKKPIVWGLGAHPVKLGLAPLLIELMDKGWITALSVNGAFMIHDFEIACFGKTSEDVGDTLHRGEFGNCEETGKWLNELLNDAVGQDMGMGEAVGCFLNNGRFETNRFSVIQHAFKLQVPVTVHAAIGTDFIHYHPEFDGAATGTLSERDFLLFSTLISKLGGGGVFLNIGSAVIIPEVFLKAISLCAGKGIQVSDFTSAVFDFNNHYRPSQNVLKRPTSGRGRGYYFIGHHEIMIPLLASLLNETS